MIMLKNQNGFTMVEFLLIVLILAVVGFGGYYVYHTHKSNKPPGNTASTNSHNPKKLSGSSLTMFKVPNLGIEIINVPASISDLTDDINDAVPGVVVANFSTKKLTSLDSNCSPSGNSNDGILARNSGTYVQGSTNSDYGEFVKQFNGFWISYDHPQAACSSNSTTEQLHVTQTQTFETLVKNPNNLQKLN